MAEKALKINTTTGDYEQTADLVESSEVSATPAADAIVQANSSGEIDAGWIPPVLRIKEADGTPDATTNILNVANGTLTVEADGSVTFAPSSGGIQDTTTDTGQILYRDASGDIVPLVIGTDGQVLTVVSGLPAWAAAGGGSAVYNVASSVDNYTSTFTADDHFTTYNTAKWTELNPGTPISFSAAQHAMVMPHNETTDSGIRGLYQSISGTSWRVQCKVISTNSTDRVDTFLFAGTLTGEAVIVSVRGETGIRSLYYGSGAQNASTGITSGSIALTSRWIAPYNYLDLEWDGTTLVGRHSNSGVDNTWTQICSVALSVTPDVVGIGGRNAGGGDPDGVHVFDWFRRVE